MEQQENLVYHYTSLKTLYNIIENQSFWLTDLWSTMDKNEMTYGQEIISKKGKEIFDLDFSFSAPAYNYYALSCAKDRDSYFHFNNYGDKCSGVSIGINRNFMEDSFPNKSCANILGYHLAFVEVLYNNQEILIDNYMRRENKVDSLKDHILLNAYNYFFSRIKRPEFKSEEEIRFIYRQDYNGTRTIAVPTEKGYFKLDDFLLSIGLEKSTQRGNPNKFKFGYFNNRIRKYYEMSIREFGINNVIKSITIGPKSKQDEKLLIEYLESQSVTAKVMKSKIELRD